MLVKSGWTEERAELFIIKELYEFNQERKGKHDFTNKVAWIQWQFLNHPDRQIIAMSLREYKIQSPKYMSLVGNGMVQEGEEEFLETEIPNIGLGEEDPPQQG